MILDAVHGGQALATALKLNNTVVDIDLAGNWQCGNEGAEACEPIWDELNAGGFDLPDCDRHWQTLTLTRTSLNNEWMDVVSASHKSRTFSLCGWQLLFCRQWQRSSARTQPSSVWTWSSVKSVMLGWRPGGCNEVVFCCSEGLPCWRVQGLDLRSPGLGAWNEVDCSWGCWEGYLTLLWQVTVFDSA